MELEQLEACIADVKNGNINSFEHIVSYYQKPLYRYIKYLLNNQCEPEDILQEVFVKVFVNINKYQPNTSFERWTYRIAHNHTINVLRKYSRDKLLLMEHADSVQLSRCDKDTLSSKTTITLSKLSAKERALFYMRIFQELSYKEIAEIMNQKENSLRKAFERSKKKFIKYYEVEGFDYDGRKIKMVNEGTCR